MLYPWFIRALQKIQLGQVVRDDGPESHFSKRGTPRVPGELSDLSRTGAQVTLMIPVEVGARVRITLDSSLTGGLIRFEGEVRWCAPAGEGYALGVELQERSPEADQLLDHLLDESA